MKSEQDETSARELAIFSHTKKTAVKEISKKSVPLIAVSLGDLAVSLSKGYLFSNLGLDSLAASALISVMTSFIMDPFIALTRQNVVFISQEYGKIKEQLVTSENAEHTVYYKNIGNIIRQGWYLSIMSSIPCGILLLVSDQMVYALGIEEEVSANVGAYFFPVAFAVPFIIATQINERFFSAVDKEKWLIPYRILTSLIALGSNFLLIPRYGTQGGGLGVLIQNIASFFITSLFIAFKKDFRKFDILNFRHYVGPYISKSTKQGLPISASMFLLIGANFGISISVGQLGNLRLAIIQVLAEVFGIATTVTHAINEATNRLVGQKVGQKNFLLSRMYGNVGLLSSALVYLPFAVIFTLFSIQISNIYISSDDRRGADDLIRFSFLLMGFAQFLLTIQDATSLSLSAYEDTLIASVVPFITMIAISFPLAALSAFLTDFDLYGILGGVNIGSFIGVGATVLYWLRQSNFAASQGFDADTQTSNAKITQCLNKFSIFKKALPREGYRQIISEDDSMEPTGYIRSE